MKNLVAFFEIPALNFDKAVKFYETVLGLQLSVVDCADEKMAFFPSENGAVTGAISWSGKNDFRPSPDGALIHLRVKNMEATLAKITANGGKITRQKTKIEAEGMGYFALFTDCEGNRLGLYADN
jgi:predicted enzyme related to lactoylglutathione lyase